MESGHTNIEDDFWGYQIFLPPFGPCQLINPNNLLKSMRMFTPLKGTHYIDLLYYADLLVNYITMT